MSVPRFWNKDDLPIGMQFVGRYGDEATLFRLAGHPGSTAGQPSVLDEPLFLVTDRPLDFWYNMEKWATFAIPLSGEERYTDWVVIE